MAGREGDSVPTPTVRVDNKGRAHPLPRTSDGELAAMPVPDGAVSVTDYEVRDGGLVPVDSATVAECVGPVVFVSAPIVTKRPMTTRHYHDCLGACGDLSPSMVPASRVLPTGGAHSVRYAVFVGGAKVGDVLVDQIVAARQAKQLGGEVRYQRVTRWKGGSEFADEWISLDAR